MEAVLSFDRMPQPAFDDGPVNPGGVGCYGFTLHIDDALVHEESGLVAPPGPDSTSNVAEYVALIRGLQHLAARPEANHLCLTIRGDSQLVVRQLKGEYKVESPRLRPLHEEASRLLAHWPGVTFQWVRRGENQGADALSKRAYEDALRQHPEWATQRLDLSGPATEAQLDVFRRAFGAEPRPGLTKHRAHKAIDDLIELMRRVERFQTHGGQDEHA